MKKVLIFLLWFLVFISYIFYSEFYLKYFIVFEWKTVERDINRESSKIIISKKATLKGDINLDKWEIIFEDWAVFSWNINIKSGFIEIWKSVEINGNINFPWEIRIWENSVIKWNINNKSSLYKHSTSKILWNKPSLFITTNHPDFLKHFDVLPDEQKKEFGYIFLTSHNMDIRWKTLNPEEYFKQIYFYENGELKQFDFSNKEKLKKLYDNSYSYINLLPERKVDRFWVWFVTKNYAFDRKKPDMYLSSSYVNSDLFLHEYGHILDYAFWYIDTHRPKYPYFKKENSITEYWKFHIWEDFAEGYRYYILYKDIFDRKAENNSEIKWKYDYFRKYVFSWKEYD